MCAVGGDGPEIWTTLIPDGLYNVSAAVSGHTINPSMCLYDLRDGGTTNCIFKVD